MPTYRSSLIAAALALAVLALPASAQETTPAACAPVEAGTPITISGAGRQQSAPFHLDGGAYRADWSFATAVSPGTSIILKNADAATGRVYELIVNGSPVGATAGQTFAYTLKPGTYFVDASTPDRWSVTLTPITP